MIRELYDYLKDKINLDYISISYRKKERDIQIIFNERYLSYDIIISIDYISNEIEIFEKDIEENHYINIFSINYNLYEDRNFKRELLYKKIYLFLKDIIYIRYNDII